jgi:phospholipase A2
LSQYLSSLTHGSLEELFAHLRTHAQTHVANIGHFVGMINSSPENAKASMQGAVQRYYQQNGSVSLVDIFGMLLGTVLLTKKETKTVEAKETDKSEDTKEVTPTIVEVDTMLPGTEQKISKQQKYVKDGSRPMPIYCLVRQGIHEDQVIVDNEESGKQLKEKAEEREKEVKADEEKSDAGGDSADDGRPTSNVTDAESENLVEKDISQERDMYQWFELTPFEVGSEELSGKNLFRSMYIHHTTFYSLSNHLPYSLDPYVGIRKKL